MSTGRVRGRDGALTLTLMIKAQLDWIPVHRVSQVHGYRLTMSVFLIFRCPNSAFPVPIHYKDCPMAATWRGNKMSKSWIMTCYKRLGNVIWSSKHTVIHASEAVSWPLQQDATTIYDTRSVVVKSPEWSSASVEWITHHSTMPLLYSSASQLRFHFTRCLICPGVPAGHFKVVSWTS